MSDKIKFIDLFAGVGGFRLVLEQFGLQCVFSSEIDQECGRIYNKNFGEYPHGDITKINAGDIPQHDFLCGGFPCQPFSISGKKAGFEDTRGTLFFEILRIVDYHKPQILLLENVKNFVSHDSGKTFSVIKETLSSLGYTVFASVLNASDYGVPSARQRVYIVAFHNRLDINDFEFPEGSKNKISLQSFLRDEIDKKYVIDRKDIILRSLEQPVIQNKPIRVGEINSGRQGERIYSAEYGHAVTFSASGGGIGSTSGLYLIRGGVVRKLAPRECYSVMGFPETFVISTNEKQAYKQIGNSVALPVVKSVVNQILYTLARRTLQNK